MSKQFGLSKEQLGDYANPHTPSRISMGGGTDPLVAAAESAVPVPTLSGTPEYGYSSPPGSRMQPIKHPNEVYKHSLSAPDEQGNRTLYPGAGGPLTNESYSTGNSMRMTGQTLNEARQTAVENAPHPKGRGSREAVAARQSAYESAQPSLAFTSPTDREEAMRQGFDVSGVPVNSSGVMDAALIGQYGSDAQRLARRVRLK